jgi:hypothetical protein
MDCFDNNPDWRSMGRDGWIKYRHLRSYNNPFPEQELEMKLCPLAPSTAIPMDQAAENVARDIHSKFSNLYVAMSGGIDSEYIAKTFLRLGLPFTPIIFKVDDLNELDIWWAIRWCKDNNIEPVIVEKNVQELIARMLLVSQQTCSRFGLGLAVLSFLHDYVSANNGKMVTGCGFPEYFPDENLDYMSTLYVDSKLHNSDNTQKQGYLYHEPDILFDILYPNNPFNFLSWSPEIVLSYISARDMTKTSADNKAEIFQCSPRPKNIGIPHYYFVMSEDMKKSQWRTIRLRIGTTECEFLGSREYLIDLLTK